MTTNPVQDIDTRYIRQIQQQQIELALIKAERDTAMRDRDRAQAHSDAMAKLVEALLASLRPYGFSASGSCSPFAARRAPSRTASRIRSSTPSCSRARTGFSGASPSAARVFRAPPNSRIGLMQKVEHRAMDVELLTVFNALIDLRNNLDDKPHLLGSEIEFLAFATKMAPYSNAQLLQDLWVLYELKEKRHGYFVEFGACDGISLSNTLLLEKTFGWQGALAEPARPGTPRYTRTEPATSPTNASTRPTGSRSCSTRSISASCRA